MKSEVVREDRVEFVMQGLNDKDSDVLQRRQPACPFLSTCIWLAGQVIDDSCQSAIRSTSSPPPDATSATRHQTHLSRSVLPYSTFLLGLTSRWLALPPQ
eukprot:superscaffoldBa00000046_g805